MSEQIKVSDVVTEAFDSALKTLGGVFEIDHVNHRAVLAPFAKVVSALRMLPAEAHEEVGAPVIRQSFEALNLDPTTQEGRAAAEPFAENIALAISDAAQYIQQNMARQAQARAAAQQRILNPAGN